MVLSLFDTPIFFVKSYQACCTLQLLFAILFIGMVRFGSVWQHTFHSISYTLYVAFDCLTTYSSFWSYWGFYIVSSTGLRSSTSHKLYLFWSFKLHFLPGFGISMFTNYQHLHQNSLVTTTKAEQHLPNFVHLHCHLQLLSVCYFLCVIQWACFTKNTI